MQDFQALSQVKSGLDKNLISSLPFGQTTLKFCSPQAVMCLLKFTFFLFQNYCLVMGLAWALTMASKQEKLFAPQENLLVLDVLDVRTFSNPGNCFEGYLSATGSKEKQSCQLIKA